MGGSFYSNGLYRGNIMDTVSIIRLIKTGFSFVLGALVSTCFVRGLMSLKKSHGGILYRSFSAEECSVECFFVLFLVLTSFQFFLFLSLISVFGFSQLRIGKLLYNFYVGVHVTRSCSLGTVQQEYLTT